MQILLGQMPKISHQLWFVSRDMHQHLLRHEGAQLNRALFVPTTRICILFMAHSQHGQLLLRTVCVLLLDVSWIASDACDDPGRAVWCRNSMRQARTQQRAQDPRRAGSVPPPAERGRHEVGALVGGLA